jgi:hypothetical protein
MSNEELRKNVTDELLWDPKFDSTSIAIGTDDGTVLNLVVHQVQV